VRELHGTFPLAAGAGLKQCCASINFSTYQTHPGIRVFSSSFPHAWHVWYLVLFCGWSEFSTSRGTWIDDETLQNFIKKHTVDLENILILFINLSQNYAHTDPTALSIRITIIMLGCNFQIAQLPQHQCLPLTWWGPSSHGQLAFSRPEVPCLPAFSNLWTSISSTKRTQHATTYSSF